MSERVKVTSKTPESKRDNSVSRIRKTDSSRSTSSPVDHILFLQRNIGNQAVQNLFKSGVIQAKLRIGQPGDIYEQEADRVAEQVMSMPEPQVQRQTEEKEEEEEEEEIQTKPLAERITPLVQRQVEEEEEEKEEEEIFQTKEVPNQTSKVTPDLESRIHALKGGGQPLPTSTRAFFEPRFGYDFNEVRIHTDTQSAENSRAFNAKAFTIGRDIVFGSGQYAPGTSAGKKILAHELTHVIQQCGASGKSFQTVQTKGRKSKSLKIPPTKTEVLRTWRRQWKLWQEQGLDDLDCGIAARTVAKSLGGAFKAKVVFKGKPSRDICTEQKCRDAKGRGSKDYWDYITRATPGICVIHEGKPGESITTREFPVQPGMLIYTSECCGGRRWACRHMMMYYADGKILDSIHLERPRPRRFGRTYSRSDSEYVVILEVLDPFAEARERIEERILDVIFKTLPFILPVPIQTGESG